MEENPASQPHEKSAETSGVNPAKANPTWERVQLARHPKRPHTLDYIERLFTDFQEIHGDRLYGDDPAIVCGAAFFEGRPIMIIGEQKGRDTKQKLHRNFGMPKPEGYRKAIRVMQLAAKFSRPVITFLDTPGAYPGIDAEERGQAEAIARNLREMSRLATPVICVCIGEGAVAVDLAEFAEDALDVVKCVWPLGMAGELDAFPRGIRERWGRGLVGLVWQVSG